MPRLEQLKLADLPLPSSPCSAHCYRHLPGALAAASPRTPRPAGRAAEGPRVRPELCEELWRPPPEERDVWTPAEETFFRSVCGRWRVDRISLWSLVCGLWFIVFGLWSVTVV